MAWTKVRSSSLNAWIRNTLTSMCSVPVLLPVDVTVNPQLSDYFVDFIRDNVSNGWPVFRNALSLSPGRKSETYSLISWLPAFTARYVHVPSPQNAMLIRGALQLIFDCCHSGTASGTFSSRLWSRCMHNLQRAIGIDRSPKRLSPKSSNDPRFSILFAFQS